MTNEEAKAFLDNLKICIDEHPVVADWLVEIADRKDENCSEKPNNCEYAENSSGDVWECGCFLDTYCEHQIYDRNPDGTINIVECGYEPKDEPITQMKTQNSNLTFKTLEYCNICDHKGCEECIANALDEHCIPSQFKKQIEDECAKEYEELGLKELKELIEADRKDEPQTDCNGCKFVGWYDTEFPCVNCVRKNKDYYSPEQTDCAWGKDG